MSNAITFHTALLQEAYRLAADMLEQHATTRTLQVHAGTLTVFDCPTIQTLAGHDLDQPTKPQLLVVRYDSHDIYTVFQIYTNGGHQHTYQADNAFHAAQQHLVVHQPEIATVARRIISQRRADDANHRFAMPPHTAPDIQSA